MRHRPLLTPSGLSSTLLFVAALYWLIRKLGLIYDDNSGDLSKPIVEPWPWLPWVRAEK